MAYREVSRVEIAEVVRRWQSGNSQRQIATGTGLSRATVRRYIVTAMGAGPTRDSAAPSEDQLSRLAGLNLCTPRKVETPTEDVLVPWADQVYEWLTADRLQVTRIHELLAGRGCRVSYTSLRRFIQRRGWQRRSPATVRMGESAPGELAQRPQAARAPPPEGRLRADLPPRRLRLVRIHHTRPATPRRRLLPPVPGPQRARPARRTGRRGQELHRSGPRICCRQSRACRPLRTCRRLLQGHGSGQGGPLHGQDLPLLHRPGPAHPRRPRSPQDDPTAVHRPLLAGHRQASYRQLRHHLQQGCRRVARTLRRPHPGKQRPRPARQRQLPDRHRRRQLPRTLVAPQGPARPKGGG